MSSSLEKIEYGGWKNCLKLSGDGVELVVTLDVGPRVTFSECEIKYFN